MFSRAAVASSILLALIPAAAHGQALVDNTTEATRAVTILGTAEPDRLWAAQSFVVPSCFSLSSVDALLGELVGSPSPVAQIRSGASPDGPLVATLSVPALSAGPVEIASLTPDAPITLSRGVYWLVIGPADAEAAAGSFGWSYAEGNTVAGEGWLQSYAYSADAGATWCCNGSDNPYHLRINGDSASACPADFNCSGAVTVQDIYDFLTDWSGQIAAAPAVLAPADFNLDSEVTVQDIYDFLSAWSAGCN